MDSVLFFLNDRSFPLRQSDDAARIEVLKRFFKAMARIRMLERPLSLGAAMRISDLPVTDDYRTIASFAERVDKDWWRLVRSIDQHVPLDATPGAIAPCVQRHVVDDVEVSEAALWVEKNGALMLSFGSTERLAANTVNVAVCECDSTDHIPEVYTCPNVSSGEHVDHWRDRILDFQRVESASSEIYRCNAFSIRMFLDDHDPPHVHIYVPGNPNRWVAKVRVDFVETQKNRGLDRKLERQVHELIEAENGEFMRAWVRRSSGQRPNYIGAAT